MRRTPIFLPAIALVVASFCHAASAQVKYELRAKTKDRVQVVFGNAKLGSFGAPGINDRGAISFAAVIFGQNSSATSNGGVFYQRNKRKTPENLLQTGAGLDTPYVILFPPRPPSTEPESFEFNSSFSGVVPEGSRYISGSTRAFRIGRDTAINKKNQTAFTAEIIYAYRTVSEPDKDTGVVTFGEPVEANKSSYGLSSPFQRGFATFEAVGFKDFNEGVLKETVSLNREGNVGFNAVFDITSTKTLAGIAYDGYRITGKKTLPDGAVVPILEFTGSLVATVESPVIGLPYFTIFSSFTNAIIADKNKLFIVADISDEGDEFDGIWQGNNPNLQPIVVKDTSAPGGGTFASFDEKIGASRKGTTVAFIANVTGGDPRSVFRAGVTGKDVIKVVSLGDRAPTNDDIGALGNFTELELAAVNNRGQIAVLAGIAGSRRGTRSGIWVSDRAGDNLQVVVVEGQDLDVDGDTKRITRIAFNPVSGFNIKGEVAFTASFSDRTSAVFVASVK